MKPKKRQKLCQSCEGEIDLDVIVCPYCAADLREEKPEKERSFYTPPSKNLNGFETLYPSSHAPKIEPQPPTEEQLQIQMTTDEESKNTFVPIFLLTLGVQFLLLGLLTLIFSHHGAVVLKWSARFWFIYVFVSIPLLVFGYKILSKE